ncbi:class I SAM-dependent methyltransferase [Actinoplanes couchii]|uniref:Class I SAM-dependent methyltransferase n=1 Tax=Actinoplanes couchii TaxID=403638 RepID=A0ABQ3XQ09_9ACTN|nr:class I SAM-dependent methyltransferase [Actinoplanes couchii]MDR6323770.1 hypothetical protein [Actinoplanes couchii]GID60595.1 hypothetical protein Aco03nite_089990 [Actinoplanes couchii]
MITMIGGEMPEYAEEHPPAAGPLYRHLADRLPAGIRVLVAGPHDTGLVRALADRREVTCLLRSRPDAETLSSDAADPTESGLTVLCGTLSKLTDADRYDVVIAFDGVGRLCSPEDTPLDWAESVRLLQRSLRPGGTLLLTVENELGIHRLVDPGTPSASRSADAWNAAAEFGTAPGRADRVAEVLGAEGLPVSGMAALWPLPANPTLLINPETLRYGPLDALAALAANVTATAYSQGSVLSDPRRLAASSVRRGIGAELAPAWLVIAQRATRPTQGIQLPPALFVGGSGVGGSETGGSAAGGSGAAAVTEILGTPDGWLRRTGNGTAEPLPDGHLLEERLLSAALGHDLPELRRLLTGWMTELPLTTAGNVLVDGARFTVLDPGEPERSDALARFAHLLIDGGYHHPWPGITDVVRLIAVLAGAAGLANPTDIPEMSGKEVAPGQRSKEVAAGQPGQETASGPRGQDAVAGHQGQEALPGQREQLLQVAALRRQLADAEERSRFFEVELEKREAELGRAKTQIAAFSGNLGYRAAKAGLVLARAARNRIRKGR